MWDCWFFTCCLLCTLRSLSNVAIISPSNKYYFGRGSSKLAQVVPLSFYQGRSACYADRLHVSVSISRGYKDVFLNSFFLHTARFWNYLSMECSPFTYDLNDFKSKINRHLSYVGSFLVLFCLTWSQSWLKKCQFNQGPLRWPSRILFKLNIACSFWDLSIQRQASIVKFHWKVWNIEEKVLFLSLVNQIVFKINILKVKSMKVLHKTFEITSHKCVKSIVVASVFKEN